MNTISEKGFSLFEVVISLSIFSIVLFGFSQAISKAYFQVYTAHNKILELYADQ